MKKLKERVLSAAVGIVVLVAILLSDDKILRLALVAVSTGILFELYRAYGFLKNRFLSTMGLLLPLIAVFLKIGERHLELPIIYIYILLFLGALIFKYKDIKFSNAVIIFVFTALISFFMAHIALLRVQDNGRILVWAIFIGAWVSDTIAYFTGVLFGRTPLAPEISPKKTVEGAVGGVLGGAVAFIIYGVIIALFTGHEVCYGRLAILGALCSVAAQIGDLCASLLKRECHIKDFGMIMPGHGGILDRFDSIIFVSPLVYYYIKFFPFLR